MWKKINGRESFRASKCVTFEGDENVDPKIPPSSNGSVCADNVLLHNKLPKISGMSCSSLSKKIKTKTRKGTEVADVEGSDNGIQGKASHISVERNRRKQMNDNLAILISLMPNFYIKRGDQASIVGGVIEYIVELQQILHLLEAKKRRKLLLREIIPSPRITLPSSKQPKSRISQVLTMPFTPQPRKPDITLNTCVKNVLLAHVKSRIAAVEVKFSGIHLVLKTVSRNIPGQAVKIIAALEDLKLEVLHVSINMEDETTICINFIIKIGFDCQLSAEDVAQQVLQTFE